MNVSAFNKMKRCMAMLALLAATHSVVRANNDSPLQAVARWSWQEPQAKVLPTGDLEWMPQPVGANDYSPVRKAGASVRYIDFESGHDANDGLSKQTPWKHHPWDPDATGPAKACQGVYTYVFKQGVVYRGEMNANESGTETAPIVLTRDPSWGAGPAVICGSEAVTGWKRGADNNFIPEPQKVWYVDLNWAPRNVWMVSTDGTVTRIALARTPNWTITDLDDIQSEWWTWKNPDKPFDNYATINGQRRHLAFDKEHIDTSQPQDYYEGAIVWTTKGWVMGSPFQARVLAVDREKGSLVFPCQWGGAPAYKIIRGCRYYLEDKPHYLDSPGEFWFDKKGNGGRLYLRLPGDQDPNTAQIEVAKRIRMIDSRGIQELLLQQHRLGQVQGPGRQTGQYVGLPGDHQLPEHVLQQHHLQFRARLAPTGAPGRPRQVPGQHLAEHGPARLPRCRPGANRRCRQEGRRRTSPQSVRDRH